MNHCIVYYSSAVKLFEEADLLAIFEKSHTYNEKFNITGVLLYINGSILQVIEGEEEPLDALFTRIKRDPRHKNVISVLKRPMPQRLFGKWAMGYDTVSYSQLNAIKELMNLDADKDVAGEDRDHIILKMIKIFYETNR